MSDLLYKALMQQMLGAELTEHLGYEHGMEAGRGLASPWPFVAGIAPHPRGLGSAGLTSDLHLDRGVVHYPAGASAGCCRVSVIIKRALQTMIFRPGGGRLP